MGPIEQVGVSYRPRHQDDGEGRRSFGQDVRMNDRAKFPSRWETQFQTELRAVYARTYDRNKDRIVRC